MDAATGPRRSRRDAPPLAKAVTAHGSGADDADPPPDSAPPSNTAPTPQRRSERHATAAAATSPGKSVSAPDADETGAARDRRRTRASDAHARGVIIPPSTAPSSPVRSSLRAAIAQAVASADASPALSSTPNRRRRPTGRSSAVAAGDAGVGAAAADGASHGQRALGKYSARECTLLCEVILDHVRRNALAADVLERGRSPAGIQWDKVARRMLKTHRLALTARECQALWKFLAYAQTPGQANALANSVGANGDAELLPPSDEEDIERPIHEIHAKRPDNRKQTQRPLFENESTPPSPLVEETIAKAPPEADATKPTTTNDGAVSGPVPDDSVSVVFKPSAAVRLYPTYELPPGSLDGWRQPFNAKKMLPLTFVAEKFLKKRAVPIPKAPPVTTTAVATVSSPVANTSLSATVAASSKGHSLTEPTRLEVAPSTTISSSATSPQVAASAAAPGVATDDMQAVTPMKKRPSADASGPNCASAGATAKTAKKKKTQLIKPVSTSSSQPRTPFTPSTTPPPAPTPAKTALDFFRLVHARLSDGVGATTIPTLEELAQLFSAAAPAIQEECTKLALMDGERFNRECVRRRIWEKAMGSTLSLANSPLSLSAVADGTTRAESSASSTVTTNEAVVSTTPST